MALDWIIWTIGIWLLIGAVCAGLVYQDQANRGIKDSKWPLRCLYLSIIGYYLYHSSLKHDKPKGRELPARAHYEAPEYEFNEPAHVSKEADEVPSPEPIERSDQGQAAVPNVEETIPEPVQMEPFAPPPLEKDQRPAEERVEPNKAKVQKIEGIPRCGECGAAVSSYDHECSSCGAPLKQ
jgi:hypothetical protein